jgi:chromosome segregation ATPase
MMWIENRWTKMQEMSRKIDNFAISPAYLGDWRNEDPMADNRHLLEDRLSGIEKTQDELRASAAEILGKLDRFQQEFQRTATAIRRIGLKQDSARHLAQEHADALKALNQRLSQIEDLTKGE